MFSCGVSRMSGTPRVRRSAEQPAERLRADRAVADQHVAVLVRAERASLSFRWKKPGVSPSMLERVEHPRHLAFDARRS
jgi:hypothetical protein